MQQLHRCDFLDDANNIVLVGGPGTGKTQAAIRALKQARLSYTGDRGSQIWIDFLRRIISKVVIEPSADGESAALAIHGHLAAIMAAQEAWQEASRELQPLHKPRLHPPAVGCR
ncbi:ATP-binding protein [Pseudorhizobium halotolerans]|uniref:ATP-binding protein n=1 Tax=Pseudorhizobium halotolerans TaxID=1233081 RepID=A0ABM8PVD1_9HYPH|nr:ATP-binding protein [Pseudorhizobium halotolerans]